LRGTGRGGWWASHAAARKFDTAPKTIAKRVERSRTEGVDGARDRAPQCVFHRAAKRRAPEVTRSRFCAHNATPWSRSRPKGSLLGFVILVEPETCRAYWMPEFLVDLTKFSQLVGLRGILVRSAGCRFSMWLERVRRLVGQLKAF